MKSDYAKTIKLLTPQGVLTTGQIIEIGRWTRHVQIPSWQIESEISALLEAGWKIVVDKTAHATASKTNQDASCLLYGDLPESE